MRMMRPSRPPIPLVSMAMYSSVLGSRRYHALGDQFRCQPHQSLTAMGNPILLCRVQLGSCAAERRYQEQRVIAEAAFSTRRQQDFTVPATGAEDRVGVGCRPHEGNDADIVRAAIVLARKFPQEFGIVRGIICTRTCIA